MCLERKARVRRTTPPPESVVAGWYENASLLDSYSIDLSSSKQYSMRLLATRTVGDPPAWIKALVAVRDAMVTPFGVKASGEVTSWVNHPPIWQPELVQRSDLMLNCPLSASHSS